MVGRPKGSRGAYPRGQYKRVKLTLVAAKMKGARETDMSLHDQLGVARGLLALAHRNIIRVRIDNLQVQIADPRKPFAKFHRITWERAAQIVDRGGLE